MRSHLWIVPTSGGEPRQLTFGERGESSPTWSPDVRFIAFLAARGSGLEVQDQIWILPTTGGEAYQLTSSKEGVDAFSWSKDGKQIAYLTLEELSPEEEAKRRRGDDAQVWEGRDHFAHLWVIDVATKKATDILHGDFNIWGAVSWSPDGTRLAYRASPTTLPREQRTDAYTVSLSNRRIEKISAHSDVGGLPLKWSPDGRLIAYSITPQSHAPRPDGIMDREIGNRHIVVYDLASKENKDISDLNQADVTPLNIEWLDNHRLFFAAGDRAYSLVFEYDLDTGKYRRFGNKLLLRGFSVSADRRTVAFSMETSNAPADIYVSDPTFSSPRKLTDLNPQIRNFALGETEIIEWKSKDGTPVEGILVKPVGYQLGKKYPLLVEAHGGPTGWVSAGFKATDTCPGQVWAGRGWATLYPNPRGSEHYGEKFMRANIGDWGGGDYQDIMSGVDELVRRGIVDENKLAFEGWSYGGYMTAWVVGQTTRFKAARMGAGISNIESMYGTTIIPDMIGAFFNGNPTKQTLDLYRARSPITYVDEVKTPLLIMHGNNDEVVPRGQALEYFRALKDRGKTVELVLYPREPHDLQEWYHQLDKMQRTYDWIVKYTLGQATDQNASPN
jgi:dipeptidyl aminopeptidase/acylaminoacyl peptidase